MLRHKFFHRALKVPISEEELQQVRKRRKKAEKDKEKDSKSDTKDGEEAESSHAEGRPEDPSASPKVHFQYLVNIRVTKN